VGFLEDWHVSPFTTLKMQFIGYNLALIWSSMTPFLGKKKKKKNKPLHIGRTIFQLGGSTGLIVWNCCGNSLLSSIYSPEAETLELGGGEGKL
jgi:hypothetical protein